MNASDSERLSLLGNSWRIPQIQSDLEEQLYQETGLPHFLLRLLISRGVTEPDAISSFLDPQLSDLHSPTLLPDYSAAIHEILAARERKERIFVHGDYDVDGVTSAALLFRFLKTIGCDVQVHVPHRMKEGYGIHKTAVEAAHASGSKLFLTCDCGVSAHEQVAMAKEFGMKVVITDHHEVGADLPAAEAVVNPHRRDSKYPFNNLSGVGVAFKLAAGITQELGMPVERYYRAYLDLACLGTVADVMPLVDENRVLVKYGLQELAQSKKPGIQALLQVAMPNRTPNSPLTSIHIGFRLGPRLNAAGRISDSAIALELLTESDPARAMEIAQHLDEINERRKAEQTQIMDEAFAIIEETGQRNAPALVVSGDWHPGIVGIVAGRLVERFYRPAFVVSANANGARGSARSIDGYHLADALHRSTHLLGSHGGHELAAGFSLEPDRIEEFRQFIHADAGGLLTPEQLVPRLHVDSWVDPAELSLDSFREFSKLEPFGNANPEPVLAAQNVTIEAINSTRNPEVFQFKMRPEGGASVDAVAFRFSEMAKNLKPGQVVDAAFQLNLDEFGGRTRLKWNLVDLRSNS